VAERRTISFSEYNMAAWWAILAATRRRMGKDNLSALAAGAAFQALLSLFPTLTAVASLYASSPTEHGERQITAMQGVLPPEAVKLIATWLQPLSQVRPRGSASASRQRTVRLLEHVVGNGNADDRR
jgi:uncharacterized BrkB/YihY/UPF0761 family membrane protein